MTEEDVRKKIDEGFERVKPKVAAMTNLFKEAYKEGFMCCFELFTGQKV